MRITIPVCGGMLCPHFGRAEEFAIIDVINDEVTSVDYLTPPPHEPGVLPAWMHELGVDVIICSGMGPRAQTFFSQYGIKVIIGALALPVEEAVSQYLTGALSTGENICEHH
jgi:ATP-binding protein involved in chromosome partitioning